MQEKRSYRVDLDWVGQGEMATAQRLLTARLNALGFPRSRVTQCDVLRFSLQMAVGYLRCEGGADMDAEADTIRALLADIGSRGDPRGRVPQVLAEPDAEAVQRRRTFNGAGRPSGGSDAG